MYLVIGVCLGLYGMLVGAMVAWEIIKKNK